MIPDRTNRRHPIGRSAHRERRALENQDNKLTEPPKIVAPRMSTPAPGVDQSDPATSRLPDDLLSDQVRRLVVFSAVGMGLWAFGVAMDWAFVFAVPGGAPFPLWKSHLVEIPSIIVSAAMFVYARYSPHPAQRKIDVGLAYMIVNAFGIAMFNTWVRTPSTVPGVNLSWNTILVLVYSMIAPVTPRKMLVAALMAASMDPLGMWLAHLRGVPTPSVPQTFIMFMPNYVCAIVATLPSHFLQRLGRQLRKARELGSYHLVEKLGQGGMGEVWRARHRMLARPAAIKLIRPSLTRDARFEVSEDARRRFEREAQVIASLRSPHTVDLFDFGVADDGAFYYVMELLDGLDADSLVRRFGPVPAERAIHLLRQVCHSLSEAESCGLVHRDIKPANIFLCRYGEEYDFVKVLDFGIVRAARDTSGTGPAPTQEKAIHGTPAFIAPEQALGGSDLDGRADIYATGCVAYWLLTGQLVFTAETPMALLLQHAETPPIPPSARTELPIPAVLDHLVLACLAKDPAERPQSARKLSRRLAAVEVASAWTEGRAKEWWARYQPARPSA